jgi:hypothetical protein
MADDTATYGSPTPPARPPRWGVVITLLIITALGAVFAWNWPTPREIAKAINPEAHGRAVGTAGERVPGTTSGAAPAVDERPFPTPTNWDRTTVIAVLDNQPLYLATSQPETIPDSNMVIEATTDEGKTGGGYHVYIPKDAASGTDVSARYYYFRTGPDRYVKVSHNRATR